MEHIHGHELINLILQENRALSLEEVKELAENKIGKNVSYFTCSESAMDTEGMISFLLDRRKLVKINGGYVINTGEVCDHD